MPLAMAMFGGGIGCLATIPFMNGIKMIIL